MKKFILLCSLYYFIIGVQGDLKTLLEHKPCALKDNKCFTKFAKLMFKTLLEGDEDLGMESIEPTFTEKIDGNLPLIKYTLYNSTVIGFKSCDIEKASISRDQTKFDFDILCKQLNFSGVYEANGTFVVLPVYGTGDFWVEPNMLKIMFKTEIEIFKGDGDKDRVKLRDIKWETDMKDVDFDVTNLFGGNKNLSDPFLRFARRRWRIAAKTLQDPAISAICNPIIDKMNKILGEMSLNDLVNIDN